MKIVVTCYDLLSDIEQNYLCDASVFENGHIVYEYDGICYKIMVHDDAVLLSVKYGDSFTRLYAKNGKGKAVLDALKNMTIKCKKLRAERARK